MYRFANRLCHSEVEITVNMSTSIRTYYVYNMLCHSYILQSVDTLKHTQYRLHNKRNYGTANRVYTTNSKVYRHICIAYVLSLSFAFTLAHIKAKMPKGIYLHFLQISAGNLPHLVTMCNMRCALFKIHF